MEPIDYVGALRRSWRLLVVLGLLGAIVAIVVPVSHPASKKVNTLRWHANAIVGSAPSGAGNVVGGAVTGAQILFYANSFSVREATARTVGLHVNPLLLGEYMSATNASAGASVGSSAGGSTTTTAAKRGAQSGLVELTGSATTAKNAVTLTNAYAHQLGTYLADVAVERQKLVGKANAQTSTPITGYEVQQPALGAVRVGGASAGIGASRKVRALAGLALGLALAAGIVLLRELLDKRLRNPESAARNFGYPVVSVVSAPPPVGGKPGPPVDVERDPYSPGAEVYRMLRMSILFEKLASSATAGVNAFGFAPSTASGLLSPGPTHVEPSADAESPKLREVVLVVSAGSETTRPQVAFNLAAIYAEAGQRVVVVSTANVEAGRATRDVSGAFEEVRPEDIESKLDRSRIENVWLLPLHHFMSNSGQLVTRAPAVLDAARAVSDVVIVETPALLTVHHAEALAQAVDVVLIVGECGTTTLDESRRAGDVLRRIGAPVLGVVLTNVRPSQRELRGAATHHDSDESEGTAPEAGAAHLLDEDPPGHEMALGGAAPAGGEAPSPVTQA